MLFCDLLRITVLLVGAVATALGVVSVVVANQEADEFALDRRRRLVADRRRDRRLPRSPSPCRRGDRQGAGGGAHRDQPPCREPGRIAFMRLWPIGLFALLVGGAGWIWPQVAAIGAGYAILTALSWRGRESAVAAIEERDGVRFYVEPSSALEPLRLIRTPGLYRDRAPSAKPPPPPPARAG